MENWSLRWDITEDGWVWKPYPIIQHRWYIERLSRPSVAKSQPTHTHTHKHSLILHSRHTFKEWSEGVWGKNSKCYLSNGEKATHTLPTLTLRPRLKDKNWANVTSDWEIWLSPCAWTPYTHTHAQNPSPQLTQWSYICLFHCTSSLYTTQPLPLSHTH